MKILFAGSEAAPFIKSGGLGDVMGALPVAIAKEGHQVAVVLPLHDAMREDIRHSLNFLGATVCMLGWRQQYAGVFSGVVNGVTYYFIDNKDYFGRPSMYGQFDDGERYAFFSKAVLETMRVTGFYPDVLQCNDWQTALAPVYLDCYYRQIPEYAAIRTVLAIHNIEFQGNMDKYVIDNIFAIPPSHYSVVEYNGNANMLKAGIEESDRVVTVSPTYAKEILDPYYAYGLEHILNLRKYKISGIINGIDVDLYNPETDVSLFRNYNYKTVARKADNKHGLQELIGLPVCDKPLIGMVTRLTTQKGLDLVLQVIHEILDKDIQMVVLGTGDDKYQNALNDIQKQYPTKLGVAIYFSADMASKIYAASDMFLMPSKYEPCGLSQMIAMRYGSVPIVRETGGLKDSVEAFNPVEGTGVGFTFKTYNAYDMLDAINRALGTYYDKGLWNKCVVKNAMKADFSWKRSAKEYIALYKSILNK